MKWSLLAVLCVVLLGCASTDGIGYDKDEAEYKWGDWSNPGLISIVDDSLAVLAIYKDYFKEWKECGFEGCSTVSETINRRAGLFLVNYREKQEPIWGDTLEHDLTVVSDYFRDSSVLVFDRNHNKFGFWKIGTNEVEFIDYMDYSGYYESHGYRGYVSFDARPFTNGNILLIDRPDYYILETESRQLKKFEFSGEYEWLSKCGNSRKKKTWIYDNEKQQGYYDYKYDYVNISYIGGKLVCINANETTDNFELTVDNVVRDKSSLGENIYERITRWCVNYVTDVSNKIYKIDTLNFKFDNNYTPIHIGDYSNTYFYTNQGGSIHYSVQDLFGINN